MFYSVELLSRKGGRFAVIWQAAFDKKNHMKKRICMDVDVPKTCEDIMELMPDGTTGSRGQRLSLYTSSMLMHGVTIIHGKQCGYLISDCNELITKGKALRIKNAIDLPPHMLRGRNLCIPSCVPPLAQTIANKDHIKSTHFTYEDDNDLALVNFHDDVETVNSARSKPSSSSSSGGSSDHRNLARAADITLTEAPSITHMEPSIHVQDDFGVDLNFEATLNEFLEPEQLQTDELLRPAFMADATPAVDLDDTILATDMNVPGAPEKGPPQSPDITRVTPIPQMAMEEDLFRQPDITGLRVLRVRRGIQFADQETMIPKATLKSWMDTKNWQTREREKGVQQEPPKLKDLFKAPSPLLHRFAPKGFQELFERNYVSTPDMAPPTNSPPWGMRAPQGIDEALLTQMGLEPPAKRARADRSLQGIPEEEDLDRADISSFEVARGHSGMDGRIDTSSLRADETSGRVSDLGISGDLSGRLSRLGRPTKEIPSLLEEPEDLLQAGMVFDEGEDRLDQTIVAEERTKKAERKAKKSKRHECPDVDMVVADMPFLTPRSAQISLDEFLMLYRVESADYGETKFETICPRDTRNRIEAAKMFYNLLALLGKKILVADQQVAYGEILIRNGKHFDREDLAV